MNEFHIIEHYFKTLNSGSENSVKGEGVQVGIGDDCCLLEISARAQLAVSVDTLVEGVHFLENTPPELLGQRALRVCLSDLAAVAAQAKWFTLALTLPRADKAWLESFSKGLREAATKYSCTLVGGDTTRGPLTISIQVMGESAKGGALLRSGAQVGDSIYVTGSLGDAAAALAILQNELRPELKDDKAYLLERYYQPTVNFIAGRKIRALANSAIDISDGLLADLGHICTQSKVGAQIDTACLPYSDALLRSANEEQRMQWASSGGDDYELCFTVSPENCRAVDEMTLSGTLNATAIGKITEGSGVQCYQQEKLIEPPGEGYKHF